MTHPRYYDKSELRKTPSILDGIDYTKEMYYRTTGARFIIELGQEMNLGYSTTATGVVYFHRFYMIHSFRAFPHYVTACSCLFLAGKVEETPKRSDDIISIARRLLSNEKFAAFGDDPRDEMMTLEKILLHTINFNLYVEHPYTYIPKYAKCLKGDQQKLQKMVQMSWTFINDSLCTTLTLQWEPEVIAIALMYLAAKLCELEIIDWDDRTAKHLSWWDLFVEGITIDILNDICHQVLDLYSQPTQKSPRTSPRVTIVKSLSENEKVVDNKPSETVIPQSHVLPQQQYLQFHQQGFVSAQPAPVFPVEVGYPSVSLPIPSASLPVAPTPLPASASYYVVCPSSQHIYPQPPLPPPEILRPLPTNSEAMFSPMFYTMRAPLRLPFHKPYYPPK